MEKKLITSHALSPVVNDQPEENRASFPIVGIGASAGGLEAMEQFFINMPANSGMGFVVIQHLSPDYKGMLRELLQRTTEMQVHTVADNMKIRPNHVYVIPPNKSMSILNGVLFLFDPVEVRGVRLPIDFFFRALAEDKGEVSVGIILSGMGSDGSVGLRSIKEVGGIILVQEPYSSKFDSMPKHAIEMVIPDIVAPPGELPGKLIDILKQSPIFSVHPERKKDLSTLEKIIILMRVHTGNDFSKYKKNSLYRRIERRMSIHKIYKISQYVHLLQESSEEVDILFKELLIGVTSFFRDEALWEHLKKIVMPDLLNRVPHGHIVRAWVAGCSTGEEAYSLAIVLKEALEVIGSSKNISLQLFATDLDNVAIEKARRGIYPSNISADVSPARLKKYFVKADDMYKISPEIREMVVFAPQNLIKDPPFTKLDIVTCRNLLIYLEQDIQKKLISMFHYSLNPGGILILGSAETNPYVPDKFVNLDSKLRIYQHSGAVRFDEILDLPMDFKFKKQNMLKSQDNKHHESIENLADQVLMQQFAPPGVLINPDGDIIYISGNTGKYLTPSAGKASLNILSMARENFRSELPVAIRKATQTYDKIFLQNISIEVDGEYFQSDIILQQLEKPSSLRGKILVIFNEFTHSDVKKDKKSKKTSDHPNQEHEADIQRLRDEVQTTREEMQTSQEELKSANEELQSTNEELQSTNEELTTSKEEMQSLNEELQTVNGELQIKNEDLARVNNDMSNLLNSIEIATLFLDRDLKIRQYTVPATKIFKLIPTDVGRVFTDQVTDLVYPSMLEDAREVIRTLVFIEKNVPTIDGRWFNIRIMPYRTLEDKIDGLVITYFEITDRKKIEDSLNDSRSLYNTFFNDPHFIIINLNSDGKVTEINPEAERLFNIKKADVEGCDFFDIFIDEQHRTKVKESYMQFLSSQDNSLKLPVKVADNGEEIKWYYQKIWKSDKIFFFTVIGLKI